MSVTGESTGFPTGYFVIRSMATGRLLDISSSSANDGTEVILWPDTETSLVENLRTPTSATQVFFVDTSGYLCSKSSGHALDVEPDGKLVLRHRKPVIQPYPSPFSHPFPRFSYSEESKQISASFACDPTYPPIHPDIAPSTAWRDKSFVLCSIPARKPRTLFVEAVDFFTTSPIFAWTGGSAITTDGGEESGGGATVSPADVQKGGFDLKEDEVLEQDRQESDEVDDSPDPLRKVRVIGITQHDLEQTNAQAARRRTWEIVPLLRNRKNFTR